MGAYFEIGLLIALIASGIIAALDKWVFARRRSEGEKMPLLADYGRSLFSVFLIVLVLRSFVVEPYRIPSGSMLPGLQIGDLILVNKFAYALRWPVWHNAIIHTGTPERGDVVVLQYPVNPHADFIKRIIGLPGDRITYLNRKLYVNGKPVPVTYLSSLIEPVNSTSALTDLSKETLGSKQFQIYTMPSSQQNVDFSDVVVPAGEYFVMGDNRDNSDDTRYWGFVPADALIGKAFLIWMSWDSEHYSIRWNRIGKVVH